MCCCSHDIEKRHKRGEDPEIEEDSDSNDEK